MYKKTHCTILFLPGVPGGVFPLFKDEHRLYFDLLDSVSPGSFSLDSFEVDSFSCVKDDNGLVTGDSDTIQE